MSLLASRLFAIGFLITLVFLYLVISSLLLPSLKTKNISHLVKIPGISLSTSYTGTRILEYSNANNIIYFGQNQKTYASFIYAK